MCAMIAKLRMYLGSMLCGRGNSPEPLGYHRQAASRRIAPRSAVIESVDVWRI
jgi:hypothetical protein